jgi:hypothetical protein
VNAAEIVAIALFAAAFAAGVAAVAARALFASIMALAAAAALVAAALAFLGATHGALIAALGFAVLTPTLLLGAVLLSARSAKAQTSAPRWLAAGAAAMIGGIVFAATGDLGVPARLAPDASILGWVGVVIFAGVVACVGMLGFGEAGAIEKRSP